MLGQVNSPQMKTYDTTGHNFGPQCVGGISFPGKFCLLMSIAKCKTLYKVKKMNLESSSFVLSLLMSENVSTICEKIKYSLRIAL
jgi:hypothetical protein